MGMTALPGPLATEKAMFLTSCPVALLYKNPIMDEVFEAHRWFTKQPLRDLYPRGIPDVIRSAVLALDAGCDLADKEKLDELKRRNGSSPTGH